VSVTEITDPAASTETAGLLNQDLVQLGSRPLRARQVTVRLEGSIVVFHRTNVRVRTRTIVHDGFVAYGVWGRRAKGSVNGMPIRPGSLLAARSGTEVVFVAEPGYESVFALLRPDEIEAHLRRRQRQDAFHLPAGAEFLHRDAAAAHRLFKWGKHLVHAATHQPESFNDRKQTRVSVQIQLLENVLSTLGSAEDLSSPHSNQTRLTHSQVVKASEDHALAYADNDLYVTDLCDAAQVSERTLEYAFKEIMGMTPTAYLTRVRLHRVRRALRTATRSSTTVSAEALASGFLHFGEFSRSYKDCFGELPSVTLRRMS